MYGKLSEIQDIQCLWQKNNEQQDNHKYSLANNM